MNPHDKTQYIERYNKRLGEYGYDPKSLGWGGGKDRQSLRFKTLLAIASYLDQPIQSVLDVGCGFADLYGYLQEINCPIAYTGVDINPALLEKAHEVYGAELPLYCHDILQPSTEDTPFVSDLVLESGIFNAQLSQEDNWDYIEAMLTQMLSYATLGVAADFMTSYVDWQAEGAFHTEPERLFRIAKSLCPRVILRHDYLPYEFCLYMIKSS